MPYKSRPTPAKAPVTSIPSGASNRTLNHYTNQDRETLSQRDLFAPRSVRPAKAILALQQAIGNQATQRFLAQRHLQDGQAAATARTTVAQRPSQAEHIVPVQHHIGNHNVLRLVATTPRVRPIIQRSGADFGLKTKKHTSSFVSEAVTFWQGKANKDKPLEDYATFLLDKVNKMLTAECTSTFVTSGDASGTFSRVTWDITINTTKFSTKPTTDTVGKLTMAEAADVADTIYHEMRHSEQYFTAAQIMAGEGSDATAIISSLSIPADVAAKAVANPIKANKKNKAMIATVKDWQKIGAGVHETYKGLVNTFVSDTRSVRGDIRAVDSSTLAAKTSGLDTTVAGWKSTELVNFKAEVDRIKKMASKSAGDKLVLSHAKQIVKLLDGAVKRWEKDKTRSVASLRKWASGSKALEDAVYAAYRDHLHEKDAWAVGGAVTSGFSKLAKKKKKK